LSSDIQLANVNLPYQSTNNEIKWLRQFYRQQEHQQKATNRFFGEKKFASNL